MWEEKAQKEMDREVESLAVSLQKPVGEEGKERPPRRTKVTGDEDSRGMETTDEGSFARRCDVNARRHVYIEVLAEEWSDVASEGYENRGSLPRRGKGKRRRATSLSLSLAA